MRSGSQSTRTATRSPRPMLPAILSARGSRAWPAGDSGDALRSGARTAPELEIDHDEDWLMAAGTRRPPAKKKQRTAKTAKAKPKKVSPDGRARRPAAHKWVYLFAEGDASMRNLLGGKGAGVAEMTRAGLPVPPGFTITTEACNAYYENGRKFPEGMWEQALAALGEVEKSTGKKFGDASNPLLVSVRSGARESMPGMMDTVLNLGLNADTLHGVINATGNERFGYDSFRRFIQMFSKIVLDIEAEKFEHELQAAKDRHGARMDTDLTAEQMKGVAEAYQALVNKET